MATFFVNIGSNLGNRRLNLSRAMRAVAQEFGNFEISHVVESQPWGFDSTHAFLNVGMAFDTDMTPVEVLHRLQDIERSISPDSHRDHDGGYVDRVIDIDIVAVDEMLLDIPELVVPHPQLAKRRFFLQPMEELAPAWRHPANGLTPAEMLESCPE